MTSSPPRRRRVAALLAGLCLLPLIEGGLALVGTRPLAEEDRFVGFEGTLPLFVEEAGSGGRRYVLHPAKTRNFNARPFEHPKPPGTFRIVAVGGSAVYGHPYLDDTSFPRWITRLLGWADPSRRYEELNAGGISYASYRDLRLLDELSRFSPDLYIAYSGHNEFLERRTFGRILEERPGLRAARALLHRSRIYSALYKGVRKARGGRADGGRTVLGESVGGMLEEVGGPGLYHRDEAFREGVLRQFREAVESMVRLSRRKGIPLILCTLPSNLSGVSPFKSEHREGLADGERKAWEKAFAAAQAALPVDPPAALRALAQAEAIDDRYALLHFVKGKALLAVGRPGEARVAFVRAKEEDIVPLRALDAFNETVREVAGREGVPLADAEGLFRRLAPHGIPGNELFADHVHPTLEGQQHVAWLVADVAVRSGLTPVSPEAWRQMAPGLSAAMKDALAAVSPRYRAMGYWVIGRTYVWAGKHDEACEALERAWATVRDVPDIPFLLGKAWLTRGDSARAERFLRAAAEMDPSGAESRFYLAAALLGQRKAGEALAELDRLPPPHGVYVQVARADALRFLGRGAEAAEALERAVALSADVPGARGAVADRLMRAGRREEATRMYLSYLRDTGYPDPEGGLSEWLAGGGTR